MRKIFFLILLLIPSVCPSPFGSGLCWGQFATPLDSSDVAGWKFTTFTDVDDTLTAGHQIYQKIDSTTAVIDSAVGAERAATTLKADSALAFTHQGIKKFHTDSTSENFVFDGAYHKTSGEADSAYLTHGGAAATYVTATLTEEEVEDYVGTMVDGGTETNIAVTYTDGGDGAGLLNFVVDSEPWDSTTSWGNMINVHEDSITSWANKVNTALPLAGGTMAGGILISDDINLTFGTDSDWDIQYDEDVDDQLLFITANTQTPVSVTDPMFAIIVGATPTENQRVFGVAKGTQASPTWLFYVDEDGDMSVTTSLACVTIYENGQEVLNQVQLLAASPTWTGAHDFGGATSLEIPAVDDPTTDAEGEIAWDANDDAIEVYMGDESESALIPAYQKIDALIFAPDGVNDEIAIFHVDALVYPFGIEVDQVSITLPADAAYAMPFEEWAGDPPVWQALIDSVVTTGTDSYMEDGTPADGAIDADDYIYLDIPATDVDWIHVQIIFHVNDGN